jgi:hypothetical protein
LIRAEVFGERLGFVALNVLIQVGTRNVGQEIVRPGYVTAEPLMVRVKADRFEIGNCAYIINIGKSSGVQKSPEARSVRPDIRRERVTEGHDSTGPGF